jgi:nucleolar protein 14
MEALNDMIGSYATTGAEASLIIERIHKSNSVRLNKNNNEKMQNFTDVLLRRFMAIGDALYENGNGGNVARYSQLDALTQTLYEMAQESPETSAAVWSRRLGFLQSAHLKRLRDVEFEQEDDNFTAWPSTGTILLLRALAHVFPVTDKRHAIVTPALLFLCEVIGFTPILSINDVVAGLSCCALALEYTKEAKRIVPEALAFLSGVIQLFGSSPKSGPLTTLSGASCLQLNALLKGVETSMNEPTITLEREKIQHSSTTVAILHSALQLAEACTVHLSDALETTKAEAFACFAESILTLRLQSLPLSIQAKVRNLITSLEFDPTRKPLQRRLQTKFQVKSLAPRMESLSTKKAASTTDRMRHEYKRERKTVARELRLDASVVESERRAIAAQKGDAAKAKRHRAHAWLEQEQATINNQVRQGGGLLSGGGIGAARAKARSAKLGMKKGGKL